MVKNKLFLQFMEDCGALLFGDFTLKSGRKSPYFINTGEYKTGTQILRLADFYSDLIRRSGVEFNVLYGPAYKGIPLAVATSMKLAEQYITGTFPSDPYVSFNRKEVKDHGEGKSVLGYVPKDGDKIAIIEDVTTAGTSIRETLDLFKSLGTNIEVVALFIAVDRMEKGTRDVSAVQQIKEDYGIDVYSIVKATDIISYLENRGDGDRAAQLREYLSNN